ncbi:MAG: PQQ-dependent sugar dehydrogenase [Ferruginibacter sp.]
MRKGYLLVFFVLSFSPCMKAQVTPSDSSNSFSYKVLASNLGYPWEVVYGPDDSLWVTEARSYKIVKISTVNGGKRTILDLNANKNFVRNIVTSGTNPSPGTYAKVGANNHPWPQGGLQGLAIHPRLLTGMPYIYVSYIYRWDSTSATTNGGEFFTTKIERYTYDLVTKTLGSPKTIIDTLPGSSDHNSGRLVIGPDTLLYYSIGDMGAGQFANKLRTNRAQNLDFYQGKILRFNTVEDNDAIDASDPFNRWIPNSNIYFNSVNGKRSAVYSYGHRNVQGLIWGKINSGDSLYASEHGPQTDDEFNVISRGRNYGHPFVNGMCDGNMNGISNGPWMPGASGPTTEQNACTTYNIKQPLSTFGTTDPSPATDPEGSSTNWTTVAPSGIDFYGNSNMADQIPNWKNSVLIPTLKNGRIIRIKLNANGNGVTGTPVEYFKGTNNRFRDLALNPDGVTIYVATDSGYVTSGPTAGIPPSSMPSYAGTILEFTYSGSLLELGSDPINPLISRNDFKIFPNPVGDVLYVQGKRNISKPITYILYDITGKFVTKGTRTTDDFSVDMRIFEKGVYILKLYNGADINIMTQKIIKQ